VVFNPRPTDLGIAPAYLTSAYRPEAPTVTVLSRSRKNPTRRGSFGVPKTPDGLYLVLIFDGEEGGAHNTWDYLHVLDLDRQADSPQQPLATTTTRRGAGAPPTATGSKTDTHRAALLGAAAGGILTLTGVYLVAWRRRRRD
jgi:hypothetical protein